jgi:hypothetical protein
MSTDRTGSLAAAADYARVRDPVDFSPVLGGPLFKLLCGARLSDDALGLMRRRIVVFSLVAWLPLLVLSAVDGHLLGGSVALPFLMDVGVHVRFLVAMPLLIAAELIVHTRLRPVAKMFMERHVVPESDTPRFEAAVASASRLRDSVLAEVLLIALVYLIGVTIIWRHYAVLPTATWYATPTGDTSRLTLAGAWYGYVSVPILQFLLLRWYFRIVIWMRLLWQVSRIDLSLIPTHPDRVGGLGFLALTPRAFAPLLLAHGAVLAAGLANQIFYLGGHLPQFKFEILMVVVFMLCLFLCPLLVFTPQLARTKRAGLREYGTLAERYVRAFDAKWLRGQAGEEPLLGSADIQSLADLANSVAVVQSMRISLVTKESVIMVAAVTLAPVLPLVLTLMPLEELLKKLVGLLL